MDPLTLPFDQYQRYKLIQELIEALRAGPALRILDVGGAHGALAAFCPQDRIVVADVAAHSDPYICADGAALPFAWRAFDVVVACDTLEHITPTRRQRFVQELARVSAGPILIAAPFHDARVQAAEGALEQLYAAAYGATFDFIAEHRAYGLPHLEHVRAWLEDENLATLALPNGYLPHWMLAIAALFLLQWRFDDPALLAAANAYYNATFYPHDNRSPAYRHVVVAGRDSLAAAATLARRNEALGQAATPAAQELPLQQLTLFAHLFGNRWVERTTRLEQALHAVEQQCAQLSQRVETLLREHAQELVQRQQEYAEEIARRKQEHGEEIARRQQEHGEEIARRQQEYAEETTALRAQHAEALAALQEQLAAQAAAFEQRQAQALQERDRYWRLAHEFHTSRMGRLTWQVWRITGALRKVFHFGSRTATPKEHVARNLQSPISNLQFDPGPMTGANARHQVTPRTDERPAARPTFDIIQFTIIDWGERFQRPQQLAAAFGRAGVRVFYLDHVHHLPPDRSPRYQAEPLAENVYAVKLALSEPLAIYAQPMTPQQQAELGAALRELRRDYQIGSAVARVEFAFWAPLVQALADRWGWRIHYDCMDDWRDWPGLSPAIVAQEEQLVAAADLVTVSSAPLVERWRASRPDVRLVRNGVDFDFFADNCKPNLLLAGLPRPIIGYYGGLSFWMDVALLHYLACERPAWSFVYVGNASEIDLSRLQNLPNVHFLGLQPYERMPQYLYHFDVCTIPFCVDQTTNAMDPVKLYEYLSAGKPVVATDLQTLQDFAETVYLARDAPDFLAGLEQALAETDLELARKRIECARQNTWAQRRAAIADHLARAFEQTSIVIVTYNNLELTQACLASILQNTTYPDYEIIIVDNASQDDTPNYLRYLARRNEHVRIILNQENLGFAKANNQGLRAAKGQYLVLLNNDTAVPRGWLARLLRCLRDPDVGLVGPVSRGATNEAYVEASYEHPEEMAHFAAAHMDAHDGQSFEIHMLQMYCVALRRDVLELVGFLDEDYGLGMFEDDDYAQRVKAAGLKTICAEDVYVHHHGQAAFQKLTASGEYERIWRANQARYERKWGPWREHRPRLDSLRE